ncbi:MAG: hypothetical protein IJR92_00025 [Alphaproteobacteria bacterium]|nr:hypothetical protein [Alphaproteobacteria bacterium]
MPIKKHVIEVYKNYKIYIVSGIQPTMFIAEKADPSKGATLVDDDLDKLKSDIDKTLDYALSVRINIWDGPLQSQTFQNPTTNIKSVNGFLNGFAIVIESNYDLDVVIEMAENCKLRKSKKHKRNRSAPLNVLRIVCRNRMSMQNNKQYQK